MTTMKICLSIGYPIKSSRSPLMHNAGYKKLGIDDEFLFLSAEVKPKDLQMAIAGVRALGIRGVSVTMPHKQEVMKYLDQIDKEAKKIGAVNTIVNNDGVLTGYNTDWIGALTALEKKTNLTGKKVAVIGAGGAARAIVYGLVKKGAKVKIFNRSLEKAKKLAQEFGCEYGDPGSLEEASKINIIINATSVGMNEDKSPIDKFLNENKASLLLRNKASLLLRNKASLLLRNQIVFDVVYSPKETRLIKDAKQKGAKIIYGYEMLLYQGVAQFELYTGMKAPVEVMRKTLERSL